MVGWLLAGPSAVAGLAIVGPLVLAGLHSRSEVPVAGAGVFGPVVGSLPLSMRCCRSAGVGVSFLLVAGSVFLLMLSVKVAASA